MLMDDGNWQEVTGVLEDGARRNKDEGQTAELAEFLQDTQQG